MKRHYLLLPFLFLSLHASAQKKKKTGESAQHIDQNFCNTLMGIVFHVRSNFQDIRGKEMETTSAGTHYACLRGVTGVETSGIVYDSVWKYEGIILQDTSRVKFDGYYKEFASHLDHCLPHSGYILTEKVNEDKALADYPDLYYKYNTGIATIAYKVDHSPINGIYTIAVVVSK